MKEKVKSIFQGVLFLVAAAFFYFAMKDFTFYIKFIPLNNVAMSVAFAAIGIFVILAGLLGKKDKENK